MNFWALIHYFFDYKTRSEDVKLIKKRQLQEKTYDKLDIIYHKKIVSVKTMDDTYKIIIGLLKCISVVALLSIF